MEREKVVVAGASGCVGRRLVAALLMQGCHVVAYCRRPDGVDWPLEGPGKIEPVALDLANEKATTEELKRADATKAYYLIHSMGGGVTDRDEFIHRDQELAVSFAKAVDHAAVDQIIYLGGHLPEGEPHSEHLLSRTRVGEILQSSSASVTQLRAGVVIDMESAAFRILSAIIDKQSTLLVPPQFRSLSHPISITDVVETLVRVRHLDASDASGTYDVGSREPCRYDDLIRWYAEAIGKNPKMIPIPWAPREVVVPYVAALTGEDFGLVWALSGSWGVDLPLHDDSLYELMPDLPRTPTRQAVSEAVAASGRRTHIHPSSRAKAAS